MCQHTCRNAWGSFHCLCDDGYQLATDMRSCHGVIKIPSSLSINQSIFIRQCNFTSKQKKEMWQSARTGNSPTKLATLRQKDRQTLSVCFTYRSKLFPSRVLCTLSVLTRPSLSVAQCVFSPFHINLIEMLSLKYKLKLTATVQKPGSLYTLYRQLARKLRALVLTTLT